MWLINLLCFFLSCCLLSFLVLVSSFLLASPGLFLRVSLRVSLLFVFCGLSSFALLLLFWFLLSSACVLFLALSFFFLCVLFLFLFLFSPFSSFCFSLVAIPLLLFFLSLRLVLQYRQLRFVLLSSVCLSLSLPATRRAGLLFLESRPLVIVLYPRYGHITPAWRLFPFIVLLLLCAMIVAALCDLPCASPFSAYPPSSWILR